MNSLRVPRLTISVLLLLAISIVLNFLVETRPGFSSFRFFCYFTNQSNILVALFFILDALIRMPRPVYDRTRGALILYMTMTSGIYWLFLHHLVHIDSAPAYLSNAFLHSGALSLLVYDLLKDRPQTRIDKRFFAVLMIYPALYLGGIMILGSLVNWYPYPFVDIGKLGIETWLLWNGVMAIAIGTIAVGIVWLNNRLIKTR